MCYYLNVHFQGQMVEVLWDVTPCRLVVRNRSVECSQCFHLPWRWSHYDAPKCRWLFIRRYNLTFLDTWHLSNTVVITTNIALSTLMLLKLFLLTEPHIKLQNLLRSSYLSTISRIYKQIPAFVYLLCTLHVKNQQLTSNWSIIWSFRFTHRLFMARSGDFTTELGRFWTEAAIGCLRAINDGIISVVCRHTNFNFYMQM